ncbi:TDT family transporter [Sporohalobacter salinus]|uniref:SLAC1 family transporter n=1 Tax=Sporohalobacter salinus TaxID=1494606 RepID=UPI001960B98D|nr:exfoliative toxin A/B [Sporohalobacter salinus]
MINIFEQAPIPIAGLMLGLAGLGNLIRPYGSQYRYIAGILSTLIAVLLVIRFLIDRENFLKELENSIVASVAPTFSMGIMILASYIIKFSFPLALYIWYGGIILHGLLIISFSSRFILNFDIKKVFPSYFIVYVGIVVASVTAPAFNHILLGQLIFWFGFIAYMILLPIISYRVFGIREIKDPALPTISIFTAPAGLCLAGYMSAFPEKNLLLVGWLTVLTLIMAIGVVIYLPRMLKVGFYPSFSAFTFPFVITAIGLKLTTKFLGEQFGNPLLGYFARIMEGLSVILVLFVLFKYLGYFYRNWNRQQSQETEVA